MDKPLVSILVPCYNRERYVEESLLSALNQDYENFELIVIDDGSTDGSREKIETLRRQHGFLFILQTNQGASGALNNGLKHAHGKYIATLDSDDIMLPGRLRLQTTHMESHPEVGCLGGEVIYIDEFGNTLKKEKKTTDNTIKRYEFSELLATAHAIGGPVAMYRREALNQAGGFDEQIRVQDFQMTLKVAYCGYYIDILPDPVALYRRHPDNFSKKSYQREFYFDMMAIAPYRHHHSFKLAEVSISNKALKRAVVHDKKYALKLFMKIPVWRWNSVTWKRFRRFLFKW